MSNAESKVWLVTGSSSGFGAAICKSALAKGDQVVVSARRPDTVEALVRAYPETAMALELDVTNSAHVAGAIEQTLRRFGRLDVLVNNAGYALTGALEELDPDEYRPVYETNFFGPVELMRAALPVFREQRSGHVINVSSMGGISGGIGMAHYAGTKFALAAVSESLAGEAAHFGVRVTILEPGPHNTAAGGAAKKARRQIDAYAPTAHVMRRVLSDPAHWETGGSAEKFGDLVVKLAYADIPPLHLPVGQTAIERLNAKIARVMGDLDRWSAAAMSTTT